MGRLEESQEAGGKANDACKRGCGMSNGAAFLSGLIVARAGTRTRARAGASAAANVDWCGGSRGRRG